MDFWTAIVAIVSMVFVAEIIKSSHKHKANARKSDPKSTQKIEELERRIESLETLIIDFEKEKRFRDLK